jgi:hypothetical protein
MGGARELFQRIIEELDRMCAIFEHCYMLALSGIMTMSLSPPEVPPQIRGLLANEM